MTMTPQQNRRREEPEDAPRHGSRTPRGERGERREQGERGEHLVDREPMARIHRDADGSLVLPELGRRAPHEESEVPHAHRSPIARVPPGGDGTR